jgi:uncharacterized coiled-coil protein SlyX
VDENNAALLAEQIRHTIDLLKADVDALDTRLEHTARMMEQQLADLESKSADHEQRLRTVSDGVTQLKVYSSLMSGSSSVLSVVAVLRSFLGM